MGSVFEVEHLGTGERLALKLLHASARLDQRAVERFKREARIAVRLKGEHVVHVVDADVAEELEGTPFLVMELLDGKDLGAFAGSLPQPPSRVVEWLRQAAVALDRAHALGVVHRDLKPENLFLTKDERGAPLVKVLDFGIAKLVDAELLNKADGVGAQTTTGAVFGTPVYMSPEQATGGPGAVGPPSDFWSLAMVAYRLLKGESYWKGATPAHVLAQIVYEVPKPPSALDFDLGEAFDRWFLRSCRRDPSSRWPSAKAQIEALAEALSRPASPGAWAGRAPPGGEAGPPLSPRAGAAGFAAPAPTTTLDVDGVAEGGPPRPADAGEAEGPSDRSAPAPTSALVAPAPSTARPTSTLHPRAFRWAGLGLAAVLAGAAALPVGARLGARLGAGRGEGAAPAREGARPFVLVLPFQGGDSRWPGLLDELLAEQLRLGDALRTPAPDARVEMGTGLGPAPTAAALGRLRRATGVDFVVTGRAREEGGSVHATIEIYDAERASAVGEAISLRGPASDPSGLAREAGVRVRRLLGRPQLSVEDDLALRSALPDGAPATASYLRGLAARRRYHYREAASHFEETLKLSPRYGPAWVGLAQSQMKLGQYKRARESADRAVEFAAGLPRADELSVYAVAAAARKDWPTAAEKYRMLSEFYPDRVDYVTSLAQVLVNGGRSGDALSALAAARGRPLSDWDRMRVSLMAAYAYTRRSEDGEALASLDEVESLAEGAGARLVLAEALLLRADVHQRAGRLDEAEALFERARPAFADGGATASLLLCDSGLARVAELRGDFGRAIGLYERIVEQRREDGNAYGVARETVQLGVVYAAMGRLARAREYFDRGGALFEEVNDREGAAHRAVNLATMDLELGALEGVREGASRGRSIQAAIGYRAGVAEADGLLARLAWLEGKLPDAEAGFEASYREAKEASESELTAEVALGRARVAFERGSSAEPAHFEDARAAAAAAGSRRADALFLALASRRALASGDAEGALRFALDAEANGRKAHSIDALAFALAASVDALSARPDPSAPDGLARRRDELGRLLESLEAVAPRLEALSSLARSGGGDREALFREAARVAEEKRMPLKALAARMELALATPAGAGDAAAAESRLRALGAKGLARAVRAMPR